MVRRTLLVLVPLVVCCLAGVASRSEALEGPEADSITVAPQPEKLYTLALDLFSRHRYDEAILRFKEFVKNYPDHKLAGDAQYWIGKCYYGQNKFAIAADEFALVEKDYPSNLKIPAALYMRGLCLLALWKTNEAFATFQQIRNTYPKSDEAAKADEVWPALLYEDVSEYYLFNLGLKYYMGEGVPKNYAEAANWFRILAAHGEGRAQFFLGMMYDEGQGVFQDKAEAVKWYRKAAVQGIMEAQLNLGLMYHKGEGVPKDTGEAVKWTRKAAEQGDAEAQLYLGVAYWKGEGVLEDYIEAYKWTILAAAHGDEVGERARSNRDSLAMLISSAMIAIAQDRARNWRPKAANAEDGQDTRQPAVPQLGEPAASGSGFFVNGKGDLITNYHVVDGCSSLRVWSGGKPHPAIVIKSDEKNDLALLRTKNGGTIEKATLRSSAKIALGEQVLVAGYPLRGLLADSLNVASGNVSSLAGPQDDSRLMQISAPAQPGNSGGPVFDQYGLVVGVVVAKLDAVKVANMTGDIPQNVNFAIKGSVLRSFLEINDTEFTTEEPKQTMKNEEIAAKAKLSTVAVECMK